ncbi:MAG: SdpI family protein [Sarcina sp.]
MNKKNKILMMILAILPFIVVLCTIKYLPDQIPAHYGFSGEVTRWGSKYESFIIPTLCMFFTFIMMLIMDSEMKNEDDTKNKKAIMMTTYIVPVIFNVLTYIFLYSSFKKITNIENSIVAKLIIGVIGVVFIVLGYYLPKISQNSVIGIRTKATLSDEEIWQETHRHGSKFMIIYGIVIILISFITNFVLNILFVVFGLILFAIYISKYSSKLYNKKYK